MVPADPLPRLMLVTDRRRTRGRDLVSLVAGAASAGMGIVQLREPDLGDGAFGRLARRICAAVPASIRIVLNGRPSLAHELGLGLHLPARHAPDETAAHGSALYGRSAHDESEALVALAEGASYIVLGTIYPTPSKPGHPGSGPELVRRVARRVAPVAIFAIGGVDATNVPELVRAGAHGVAVCGAILSADDPVEATKRIRFAL